MLWGILIGVSSVVGLEFLILWIIKQKLSGGGKVALSPKVLLEKSKNKKWDGKYIVYRSDGKPLDNGARFFLMKFDEPQQQPEREALQLYADLIDQRDPNMAGRIKTAIKETQVKEGQ